MAIKAIETRYKGYRFRSRLEARWAVFFDALGIRYEYEPQGFEISSHDWLQDEGADVLVGDRPSRSWKYLPDFFLPGSKTWVEVKGTLDGLGDDYFDMIAWAIDWGGALPHVSDSYGTTSGLLWLGPLPDLDNLYGETPAHVIFQHCKGVYCRVCRFQPGGISQSSELEMLNSLCPQLSDNFDASCSPGSEIKQLIQVVAYNLPAWRFFSPLSPPVADAYRAARSARFEHGETPR